MVGLVGFYMLTHITGYHNIPAQLVSILVNFIFGQLILVKWNPSISNRRQEKDMNTEMIA